MSTAEMPRAHGWTPTASGRQSLRPRALRIGESDGATLVVLRDLVAGDVVLRHRLRVVRVLRLLARVFGASRSAVLIERRARRRSSVARFVRGRVAKARLVRLSGTWRAARPRGRGGCEDERSRGRSNCEDSPHCPD